MNVKKMHTKSSANFVLKVNYDFEREKKERNKQSA